MKVDISYQDLTELRISRKGKLVTVGPSGVEKDTDYVWERITVLICNSNHLQSLPTLPKELTGMSCSSNKLQSLPTLPEELRWLICDHNHLQTLPPLPEGLEVLYCRDNRLQALPRLPGRLEWFQCSSNPFVRGVCREIVPLRLRKSISEETYDVYDKLLTLQKQKFEGMLEGVTVTPL